MKKKALLGFSFLTALLGFTGIVPTISLDLAFAKPPDWAPAHGYRRKHEGDDRKDYRDDDREDWKQRMENELEERFPGYKVFVRLDENRDGRISRQEWNEGNDLFDKLDKNNDGYLSRTEYARVEEERGVLGNLLAKVKEKVVGFFASLF
ncbi:MAG TPA: EF-hand domain-containing protein [bacterium]|nr:EF-hand domain-containing protein [bacterium]